MKENLCKTCSHSKMTDVNEFECQLDECTSETLFGECPHYKKRSKRKESKAILRCLDCGATITIEQIHSLEFLYCPHCYSTTFEKV